MIKYCSLWCRIGDELYSFVSRWSHVAINIQVTLSLDKWIMFISNLTKFLFISYSLEITFNSLKSWLLLKHQLLNIMFSFPSLFHRCKYCTNFLSETGLRKKAYLHACFDYIFFSFMKDAFSQDAPIPSIPWNVSIIERSARRVRTLHTIMQQRGHFFFFLRGGLSFPP